MEVIEKEKIANALAQYCERYESQNRAANSLKGVSAATVSQILRGNWDLIKDEMWRNIKTQINFKDNGWVAVPTVNYLRLMDIMNDARANALAMGVTGNAGGGKTFALSHYAASNKRVYLMCCNEYWSRKDFMRELMGKIGKDANGRTVGEMMSTAIRELKSTDSPLLILDEADKLTDSVLLFFITLYNQLEDECGIILCATDHLSKRITDGVDANKKGYSEIWSRLGRRCIELQGVTAADITAICEANGVTKKNDIDDVIAKCDSDLRRVKRLCHAVKEKAKIEGESKTTSK